MKYTKLFAKTRKSAPSDADTVNHKLLVQAGFVRQVMAGVYSYLPLGLRTLNKIRDVIRDEMNTIGGQEVLMGNLHPASVWKQTGGWDNIDILFKLKSRTGKDYALAQSHEEIVTPLAKEFIQSYKDMPVAVYQIQWHFRDELRAKSGILRGREFEMKDMYSFHEDQEDFERFYAEVKKAYLRAYERVGLTAKVTEASGGSFTDKISYEFMVITDAGEDDILYCSSCEFCVNTEITKVKEGEGCSKCGKGKLVMARASETGNVFDLGLKYSKDFDFTYTDKNGEQKQPVMGCYGWGTSRTMGVLVEKFHDDKGIVWPTSVAPYHVQLIGLNTDKPDVVEKTESVYKQLTEAGIEVLYDDRVDAGAGQKFTDADLIGNPVRVVVSSKTGNQVEMSHRGKDDAKLVSVDNVISEIESLLT